MTLLKDFYQPNRAAHMRVFFFLTFVFAHINTAFAAGSSLGSMATGTSTDLVKFGPLVEVVAYLGGAFFFIAGFFQLLQAAKQQGMSKGPAMWTLLIAIALLGFGAMVAAVSGTVFGSDEASSGLGKLGIGR